jgi:hypothetical protein
MTTEDKHQLTPTAKSAIEIPAIDIETSSNFYRDVLAGIYDGAAMALALTMAPAR